MKVINVLDSNTIDKIAAGEVVERPSSVAKELIENAIDAGATFITVEIKDGGISLLRVTDNGDGVDKSEIKKAFMRHATSKIKSIEDLLAVTSLGFRGEALSSISSVSKVEFLTKTKEDFIGTRYIIEGGRECVFEEAGVPDGTTIIVRDLFYNIPARRKFLKTSQTEGSYITELIEHMIISHPDVAFKYIINGNVKLQSSGNGDIKNCIYTIYGRDIANNLISINSERDDISITGFIGKPELARSTRNFAIYFVNNRYIRSSLIDKALDDAYKPFLMLHKYPTVFLYFDIPGYLIDVNVHPAKREIRFIEGESIRNYIINEVKKALEQKELIPEIQAESESKHIIEIDKINPEPFEVSKAAKPKDEFDASETKPAKTESIRYDNLSTPDIKSFSQPDIEYNAALTKSTINISSETNRNNEETVLYKTLSYKEQNNKEIYNQNNKEIYDQLSLFENDLISEVGKQNHRIIGQLFNTYWLIEFENKLFIMDQHAAHEKINYERLIKKLRNNEQVSQNIYPPIVITLSNVEADYVNKYIDNFAAVGFTIEHFGGREYTISTVPLELLSQNPSDYFHDMLDDIMDGKLVKETDAVNLKIATMACKSAVKGNMKMTLAEAEALVSELMTLDNPYNCPHGRPTMVSYSKYEIEKMFKRVVN